MSDRTAGFGIEDLTTAAPSAQRPLRSANCNRCGFTVNPRPWGCKNPCQNCGTVYPLGDCSD